MFDADADKQFGTIDKQFGLYQIDTLKYISLPIGKRKIFEDVSIVPVENITEKAVSFYATKYIWLHNCLAGFIERMSHVSYHIEFPVSCPDTFFGVIHLGRF